MRKVIEISDFYSPISENSLPVHCDRLEAYLGSGWRIISSICKEDKRSNSIYSDSTYRIILEK